MGNRFGRNQKRRMREEIALQSMLRRQAQAALQSETSARRRERGERLALEREMTQWAERIVALLGPASAFARDLHEIAVDPDLFDSVAHGGHPMRLEPRSTMSRVAAGMTMREACEFVDLFATTAVPERDGIPYLWRFLIRGKDGAAAMMMDERTIQTLKSKGDRVLRDYLVGELVRPWMSGEIGR